MTGDSDIPGPFGWQKPQVVMAERAATRRPAQTTFRELAVDPSTGKHRSRNQIIASVAAYTYGNQDISSVDHANILHEMVEYFENGGLDKLPGQRYVERQTLRK